MVVNKSYPSKKAKRRAEYLEREEKRKRLRKQMNSINSANNIEEMAAAIGIRLK